MNTKWLVPGEQSTVSAKVVLNPSTLLVADKRVQMDPCGRHRARRSTLNAQLSNPYTRPNPSIRRIGVGRATSHHAAEWLKRS
jgi:hypothetical protein